METVFIVCAAVGGTLLLCQFLLTLLGIGDHHDVGHDIGHDVGHAGGDHGHDAHHQGDPGHETMAWLVGMLSFRTVMAGLTFFGLMGLIGTHQGWETPVTLGSAVVAGASALFLVAWLMRTLYGLRGEGTVRVERAIGQPCTVYLSIPGQKQGVGKVQVNVQNRTVEYQALTAGASLPTGSKVVVV